MTTQKNGVTIPTNGKKEECIYYCIEHLETRSLKYIFNSSIFNTFFERHFSQATSIYLIGINAADEMIFSAQAHLQEVNHD